MNSNIPTSSVLHAAADAIEMAGWGKGVRSWRGDGGTGLCLEGGIAAAAGIDIGPHGEGTWELSLCPAHVAVKEYLAPVLEDACAEPWYFNDRIAETAEDVIAVLRGAAEVEYLKEQTDARLPGEPSVYETDDQPLPLDVAA